MSSELESGAAGPSGPAAEPVGRFRHVALAAVAYGLLSWLTMAFMSSAGFAMPLWPAAGVALGLTLIWGPRVALGVAIGSFTSNAAVWLAGADDLSAAGPALASLALIGLGAGGQARLGAWLVRRRTTPELPLLSSSDIILFLFLGGPVACSLNASVGLFALAPEGIFGVADQAHRWWTWWLGDVAGVALAAPAVIALAHRRRQVWIHRVAPLTIGLGATAIGLALLLRSTHVSNDARLYEELSAVANVQADAFHRALQHSERVASSLTGIARGRGPVDAETFRVFAKPALRDNAAITAVSWNPVVSGVDDPDWRGLDGSTPQIWEAGEGDTRVPVSPRADYVAIRWIEPLETQAAAIGFDISSELRRSEALLRARASRKPAVSFPVELVQRRGPDTTVLVVAPVFGQEDGDVEAFAVCVLNLDRLLSEALLGYEAQFSARLLDVSGGGSTPLADVRAEEGDWKQRGGAWSRTIEIGGRSWQLDIVASKAEAARRRAFVSVGAMTLNVVLAWLSAALLLLLSGRGDQERLQVRELSREVSERQRVEVELQGARESAEYRANHDGVTGLNSRARFEAVLESLTQATQGTDRRHALAFIDLDQFKLVNDTVGHAAGDLLLREVGGLLHAGTRAGDTLARMGGDEFGLLLPDCPLELAVRIGERLVARLGSHRFVWEERPFSIGASVGLVEVVAGGGQPGELLARADVACYVAKDSGRGRVHVYAGTDESARSRHEEMITAAHLRDIVESGRLRLFRQPIVRLIEPRSVVSYEVLVRLVKADGSLAPPSTFIPAAERFGVMGDLDLWVVRRALRALATWPDQERVSINLSGSSLSNRALLRLIEGEVRRFGFAPSRVSFEITETAAIRNLVEATEFMGTLRSLGCRFVLDDFGSGMASFGYLKSLAVDGLKIDASFTADAGDPTQRILLRAMRDLTEALGIEAVAEGAESDEIVAALLDLGIVLAQGYALGRPEPLPDEVDL